ncbi:hypothetical protein K438DRAFT_1945272 [Mycena galopus ATCC 62051]|nr:hypothetical protein K438DRAFT_1945272 [Mycena galopus ATCC 62051]
MSETARDYVQTGLVPATPKGLNGNTRARRCTPKNGQCVKIHASAKRCRSVLGPQQQSRPRQRYAASPSSGLDHCASVRAVFVGRGGVSHRSATTLVPPTTHGQSARPMGQRRPYPTSSRAADTGARAGAALDSPSLFPLGFPQIPSRTLATLPPNPFHSISFPSVHAPHHVSARFPPPFASLRLGLLTLPHRLPIPLPHLRASVDIVALYALSRLRYIGPLWRAGMRSDGLGGSLCDAVRTARHPSSSVEVESSGRGGEEDGMWTKEVGAARATQIHTRPRGARCSAARGEEARRRRRRRRSNGGVRGSSDAILAPPCTRSVSVEDCRTRGARCYCQRVLVEWPEEPQVVVPVATGVRKEETWGGEALRASHRPSTQDAGRRRIYLFHLYIPDPLVDALRTSPVRFTTSATSPPHHLGTSSPRSHATSLGLHACAFPARNFISPSRATRGVGGGSWLSSCNGIRTTSLKSGFSAMLSLSSYPH